MRLTLAIAATALLAGCADPAATNNAAGVPDNAVVEIEDVPANEDPALAAVSPVEALPTDAWIGKWTGPEGLALDIAKTEVAGTYKVTVLLLDGTDSYEGTAEDGVISFMRGGTKEVIRAASGDETGLKYLAGKSDCLMIKQAEGFCRG